MKIMQDISPTIPTYISKKQHTVLEYLYRRSEKGLMWVKFTELQALFRRRGLDDAPRALNGVCSRMVTREWVRRDPEDGPVFRIHRLGRQVLLGIEFGDVQVRS